MVLALLLSLKKECMVRSWWMGRLVDGVVLVKILGLAGRAGNVAVVVVVVDMRADTGSVAVHMCGRTKARVGVSSEVGDGPFRWDSCMMAVPSASESVGDALS
jgi:hypothetical protein